MIRFLQSSRGLVKAFLGLILLLICAALVITLIPGGPADFTGAAAPAQGVYANVGERQVTLTEIQRRAQNTARQQGLPAQFAGMLAPQVADQMVTQLALLEEAHRIGLTVTDDELRDELQNGFLKAQLFPDGKWVGQEKYEEFTQQFGFTIPQFEKAIKEDLLMRKLQAMVAGSVAVGDDEVNRQLVKQNVKVQFEYAVFTPDAIAAQIRPSDAELRKFFQDNQARYKDSIPEQRKLHYAVVDAQRVRDQVQVTPDDLQRYYNDHREQFRVQDEVMVRHILVKADAGDPRQAEAAKAKAQDLLKQLRGGADFAALAKQHSDDTVTAVEGGMLGWVGRGRTVPEFEQAAFSLQKGQLSEVVQTSYGFHILKLEDKRAAHLRTLDEVKAEITPVVAAEKAAQAAEQLAARVASEARGGGLQAAAARNGLNVITTDFIGREAVLPGVGASPEFAGALFGAPAKTPAVAELPQGYAVYEVLEVRAPQTPAFEQVRGRVANDYREQMLPRILENRTRELSDRARALHNLRQAAKELGAQFFTSDLVGLNSQVPEIGAMANVEPILALKPGEISGPMMAGRNSGVVAQMLKREEPSPAEMAAKRDEVRELLVRQKQNEALLLFATAVRQRMEKEGKIRISPEAQQSLQRRGSLG